jgi:lysophospholipase L1-like esterase
MPAFPELVRLALAKVYGGPVELVNLAKGGTGAGYGVEVAPQVAALRPDLVFIAFGMNDVGGRKSEGYRKRVAQIMQIVRDRHPAVEFILVATMRANPQWALAPAEQFAPYRDALAGLCGPGVVLADVTSLWTDLLARKNYHDLTGNGVNHANDYGHRLYAQVILSLLVEGLTPKP